MKELLKKIIMKFVFQEPSLSAHPFGTSPQASVKGYQKLYNDARQVHYPEIDEFEQKYGFAIDKQWIDTVALHTQIVVKESRLNYQHGRLLYSVLRKYLAGIKNNTKEKTISILETGTARGFSALCMAKALTDSNHHGVIVTIDMLPHNKPILWNCIDDHEGPKTRQQLLSPWHHELSHIVFIQGWTKTQLSRTGLSHINFAFLDAQHTAKDVMTEYYYVCDRQQTDDIIVFDDVTPGMFDGVVQAVKNIETEGKYSIERIQISDQRGYAVGVKL